MTCVLHHIPAFWGDLWVADILAAIAAGAAGASFWRKRRARQRSAAAPSAGR